MSYSTIRRFERQDNQRLRAKLALVQRLLREGLGTAYLNAPDGSPLAEVRRILRGE